MNNTQPRPERTLLEFTPHDLLQHLPNLPAWAVHAFQSLQGPPHSWTPEARALLNMAHVPPIGMPLEEESERVGTTSKDLRYRDVWRLSRDLTAAKNAGWKQSEGKKNGTGDE